MTHRASPGELLAAFESQIRRQVGQETAAWTTERIGPLVRMTTPDWSGRGGGVVASDLGGLPDEAVDAVIAEQVAYFARIGRPWEWKHYAHDLPSDLPDRLRAAGLVPEEEEALVIGEVADVLAACADAHPPAGVDVREPLDADHAGMAALTEQVWGEPGEEMTRELLAEKGGDPDAMTILVAVDGAEVVCAAWIRFHAGTEFASLWGGSTLPQWRRRGIYRDLVRRRAEQARERGYRYLQVDASPESRPILERLGLQVVSTTTPYVWTPPAP